MAAAACHPSPCTNDGAVAHVPAVASVANIYPTIRNGHDAQAEVEYTMALLVALALIAVALIKLVSSKFVPPAKFTIPSCTVPPLLIANIANCACIAETAPKVAPEGTVSDNAEPTETLEGVPLVSVELRNDNVVGFNPTVSALDATDAETDWICDHPPETPATCPLK